MISTSSEPLENEDVGYLHDVSQRPNTNVRDLQDDVERLIEIAAQLFSAIERQIHLIEEELVTSCGETVRTFAHTAFKERLIRCAESLDTSVREIAVNLEHRANGQLAPRELRSNSSIDVQLPNREGRSR